MGDNWENAEELQEQLLKGWSHLALEEVLGDDSSSVKAERSRVRLSYLDYMNKLKCIDNQLASELLKEEGLKYGELVDSKTGENSVNSPNTHIGRSWKSTLTFDKLLKNIPSLQDSLKTDDVQQGDIPSKTNRPNEPECRKLPSQVTNSKNVSHSANTIKKALFSSNTCGGNRHLQTFQEVNRHLQTPQDTNRYLQMPQDANRHLQMPQDANWHLQTPQGANRHLQTPQDANRHLQTPQDANRHLQMPQGANRHLQTFHESKFVTDRSAAQNIQGNQGVHQENHGNGLFWSMGGSNLSGQSDEPPRTNMNSHNFRNFNTAEGPCGGGNKRPRSEEDDDPLPALPGFRTAREQLAIDNMKPGRSRGTDSHVSTGSYGTSKKSLGTRRGLNSKFVPPVATKDEDDGNYGCLQMKKPGAGDSTPAGEAMMDERLKHIEPKMVELILSEILDHGAHVEWDDIAGLEFAKKTIKEIVVFPMLRPDLFTGLRGPPKGLLLFGPPGTGKTLIGKCIANQSKSTFFSISASSLTSKWIGEGEKMVRALFAVARVHQPAVVFMDEIDSLLTQRSDTEHESSRRIKTEFLVQLDGATTGDNDRILVVGATNRPQEIDEAARRRFVKKLYIPLPEGPARRAIVQRLMAQQRHCLTQADIDTVIATTQGYSGADMANLCKEAAMGPIRSLSFEEIQCVQLDEVRPITMQDFETALQQVKPSVSQSDLTAYVEWNKSFGSWSI